MKRQKNYTKSNACDRALRTVLYTQTSDEENNQGADAIKKFTPSLGIPYLGV